MALGRGAAARGGAGWVEAAGAGVWGAGVWAPAAAATSNKHDMDTAITDFIDSNPFDPAWAVPLGPRPIQY